MNKAQFMKQLEQNLAQLPWEEIRKRIDYYEEMIDDRMEDGMTEAVSPIMGMREISQWIRVYTAKNFYYSY